MDAIVSLALLFAMMLVALIDSNYTGNRPRNKEEYEFKKYKKTKTYGVS